MHFFVVERGVFLELEGLSIFDFDRFAIEEVAGRGQEEISKRFDEGGIFDFRIEKDVFTHIVIGGNNGHSNGHQHVSSKARFDLFRPFLFFCTCFCGRKRDESNSNEGKDSAFATVKGDEHVYQPCCRS